MRNLTISLALLSLAGGAAPIARAQSTPMQPGIHVEMATTTGAAQLPDADNPDAWIVTVTANGDLYFGTDQESPESLLEAMKNRPLNRGRNLYIKADARAPFSSVKQALDAARADSFKRLFLLTASTKAQRGSFVPPTGLSVLIEPEPTANAVIVYIDPSQGSPTLRIGNEAVPLKLLHRKLLDVLRDRSDGVIIVKPGPVPFADVAHVVDASSGIGPVVALSGGGQL